ncbi:heavy metal-binding domain-containing protein [Solwaraspora sp. WMMD792]|uniref:YbjQ family protein n=1 Tax=Solwaraspora sp. WMMD792 TaxID=3016099 RepID=UPI0024175372|nr:heavy metal-binding domain-containing protein [Solwaraspora sp. WMMD792]MDG4773845.1 heavy metal-binding domain-containing protein [Solwaraspora sp. WMMD792]
MLIVTTNDLPGYEIRIVLGEVVTSVVRSINPFKEGVKALRGGKSDPGGPASLTKYRTEIIGKLGDAAKKKGANAVIGMRFDTRQVGSTHMELCAYGTAAVVLQIRPDAGDDSKQSKVDASHSDASAGNETGGSAGSGSR